MWKNYKILETLETRLIQVRQINCKTDTRYFKTQINPKDATNISQYHLGCIEPIYVRISFAYISESDRRLFRRPL